MGAFVGFNVKTQNELDKRFISNRFCKHVKDRNTFLCTTIVKLRKYKQNMIQLRSCMSIDRHDIFYSIVVYMFTQ